MITRYFIEISYDGKEYHGWQIQPSSITIQQVLTDCLSKLLKYNINLVGAGRTDTGVHAKQMFAHFDLNFNINDNLGFLHKINSFLPQDIYVKSLKKVKNETHARFDAISRKYEYIISKNKSPLFRNKVYHISKKLNIELMKKASNILFDFNDFTSFSKLHTQTKTNNCDIKSIFWKEKDDFLIFQIEADRFLRNMVRAIVGTLIDIGLEKITLIDFENIIKSKDRSKASASAPAHALYLISILYPKHIWHE